MERVRSMSNLTSSNQSNDKLKSSVKDVLKDFRIRTRDFERKLEFNNNSDPLNLWYEHITWIWDNNAIVDKEQRVLINLIEKCIEKFASEPKYKNDTRFYDIFYKYTQITSDPDDVYDSIFSLSLFEKLAKFYISWSWVLVNLSREEKALEILNLGEEKNAEPNCLLVQAKEELENKIKEKKSHLESASNACAHQNSTRSNVGASVQAQLRKSRLSIDPLTSTMILTKQAFSTEKSINRQAFSTEKSINRQAFSTEKSINRQTSEATTPKENLLIKSSGNRQGFEILEEEDTVERKSTESVAADTVNEQKVANTIISTVKESNDAHLPDTKSTQHQNSKVKQNLIEKLKPLEQVYKEPKIVIFENLKANQKFYADLKRAYCDNTEYSFEEIRMRKMKRMSSKKRKEEHKESQANNDLIKEIEALKAKIKENEEREREKDSLQNQVDMLKKQIEMIIASSMTTQNSKRCVDEIDTGLTVTDGLMSTKRLRLSENKQLVNSGRKKLREITSEVVSKKDVLPEKELTIVRDMWNGTFASQYSPANFNHHQSQYHHNKTLDQVQSQQTQQARTEQFSIFKDPVASNLTRTNDFSYYPQLLSTTANQDCFTIALPHDPSEFNAKLASTPAMSKQRRFQQH